VRSPLDVFRKHGSDCHTDDCGWRPWTGPRGIGCWIFNLREGTDGIVVAGTTGESPVLVMDEIEELTRRAVARCRGKLR